MTALPETSYEVRLIIHRDASGCTARWLELDGQLSESFTLRLPIDREKAAELRWYLEEYVQFAGAGDRARAQTIEAQLTEWGRELFKAIFTPGEGTQVYNDLMNAVRQGQRGLLTLGSSNPEVLVQPWEMLRDRRGPLVFQGVTLRRQLTGAGAARDTARPGDLDTVDGRLRVLLIVSRPTDAGFIDPRNSLPSVLDALDLLPSGSVQLDFCTPPTLAQLEERLSQARKAGRPYHILHFDGHGAYLPKTGVGALAFEREDAATHLVTGTQLGDLLARQRVPLVLLEACRGADLSERPVFGSVAPALLESGVGSVAAFSHAVHIQAAHLLVERFYRELVSGQSIGQALGESRRALHANPSRFLHLGPDAASIDLQDWFIPQLYQVGTDPVLVAAHLPSPLQGEGAGVRVASPSSKPLYNFPPPPLYRFHGRALELLELERAFRRHSAVLLHAMGGMGKTALGREAAAWWLRTGLFEAAVFCSFEDRSGAERAVSLLGQALEGPDFAAHSSEEQWQRAVGLFRERKVLVVRDNFESTLPIYQLGEEDQGQGIGDKGGAEEVGFGDEARRELHRLYREMTEGAVAGDLPAGGDRAGGDQGAGAGGTGADGQSAPVGGRAGCQGHLDRAQGLRAA